MMPASDFRSDTVTRPDRAMRLAMAEASVGDDVFGDDPTAIELERLGADALGHEAALFLPSGTMANQVAVRVHTRPGDEVILHEGAHIYRFEQAGLAALHGVQAVTLPGPGGQVDLQAIEASIRRDDAHLPRTRLIALENTHNLSGGRILPEAHLRAVRALADSKGLALHLDGARLANAAAATGRPLAELGRLAHSTTLCLSKGLGAPAGTLLAGSKDFIRAARRARKLLGGAMRQVGILAAAGRLALIEGPARLHADHARARTLAAGLAELPGVVVEPPETNLVLVACPALSTDELVRELEVRGVRTVPFGPGKIRMALHRDLGDVDVARALDAFADLAERGRLHPARNQNL